MDKNLKINLEKIFRDSTNFDALFDAFQMIVFKNIKDFELTKLLLANPVLNPEELLMFTEKSAELMDDSRFQIFMWAAAIFETKFDCIENSHHYYLKAHIINPADYIPLIKSLELYDYEMETPWNFIIEGDVINNIKYVKEKSKVYFALAVHFNKLKRNDLAELYLSFAEAAQKEEN